jgi:iron complex transport system substrate-binding protein
MKRSVFTVLIVLLLYGTCLSSPPARIVSLAPSITEILYALGLERNIVAVTNFCDQPPRAKNKPKIGGMSNPSLEAIVSDRPDIVIMTTDGNPKGIDTRLQQLGIHTYVVRATRIAELPDAIRNLGEALDIKKKADDLASGIEKAMTGYKRRAQRFSSTASSRKHKRKAIFIIWPDPLIVAGPGTAVDDVLNLLGWENIASDAGSRYPKYSLEEIINRSPDVILIGKMLDNTHELSEEILKKLSMTTAVKKGRVYYTGDALYRLGPRVVDGTRELAEYLLRD